jgi:hypothetical protein
VKLSDELSIHPHKKTWQVRFIKDYSHEKDETKPCTNNRRHFYPDLMLLFHGINHLFIQAIMSLFFLRAYHQIRTKVQN